MGFDFWFYTFGICFLTFFSIYFFLRSRYWKKEAGEQKKLKQTYTDCADSYEDDAKKYKYLWQEECNFSTKYQAEKGIACAVLAQIAENNDMKHFKRDVRKLAADTLKELGY